MRVFIIMTELKDWLNSINFTKEDLIEHTKDYPPYIVNRCLSGQPMVDSIEEAIDVLSSSQIEYLYLPDISQLVRVPNDRS